jgi:hypothetical protein
MACRLLQADLFRDGEVRHVPGVSEQHHTFFDTDAQIGGNSGTESVVVFNDRVSWMVPGNRRFRPYLVKLNNLNYKHAAGTDSVWMGARWIPGMGVYATKSNTADRLEGTMFEFNVRLYMANSGSVRNRDDSNYTGFQDGCNNTAYDRNGGDRCRNDGGIARSASNNPGTCTDTGCTEWADVTPQTTSAPGDNNDYRYYFSKLIDGNTPDNITDLTPADRPVPGMAKFGNNLYMIRNACTRNMINTTCTTNESYTNECTDDVVCTAAQGQDGVFGYEVWQLWKCVPDTVGGDCDADDWSLLAQRDLSTGINADMRDKNNQHAALLLSNGTYLYVGFDNGTTGQEIWRTSTTAANGATGPGDFTQMSSDGLKVLTDDPLYTRIFSYLSIYDITSNRNYMYISAGRTGPVAVFRQWNN